jgi:hypothetical protein
VALAIVAILVLGTGVVGYLHWHQSNKIRDAAKASPPPQAPAPRPQKKPSTEKAASAPPARSVPTPAVSSAPPTPTAPAGEDRIKPTRSPEQPKAITDFKTGNLKLEKATGSSLVYAIGVLTNDSWHQRYGVRIEIALTDANGQRAGVARDYRPVLEPGEMWRFRALILDSRARSGVVKEIMEDP